MMTPEMMTQMRREFGEKVRHARVRIAGLSLEQVAQACGCTVTDIEGIESGNAECGLTVVLSVCQHLGISEDDTFVYDDGIVF